MCKEPVEEPDTDSDHNDTQMLPIFNKENYSLLAIAHYNVGAQHEFLKDLEMARKFFKRSVKVLTKYFDPDYPLLEEFEEALHVLERKLKKKYQQKR